MSDAQPAMLPAILHPYQRAGIAWLEPRRTALLADEMGLGKTVQAILAGKSLRSLLVVCPPIAIPHWIGQFERWDPDRKVVAVRTGDVLQSSKQRVAREGLADPRGSGGAGGIRSVTISTYGLVRRHHAEHFQGPYDAVVVDEAHNLRGDDAQQAAAFWGRGGSGILSRAARRWFLTGTPFVNHAGDLHNLLYCTGRTKLGRDAFLQRYTEGYVYQGRYVPKRNKAQHLPELQALLAEVMLRRTKDEAGVELPPMTFQTITVDPGPVLIEDMGPQWFIPVERHAELKAQLESEQRHFLDRYDFDELEVLAESVATLRRYSGLQKIQPVADLVADELTRREYDKVVLFAEHRAVVEGLRSRLEAFGAATIYGGTSNAKREKHIASFRDPCGIRVLICNTTACKEAIDLTAASVAYVIESPWVPSTLAQACGRLHRLTQRNAVFIRLVELFDNPVDRAVAETLASKLAASLEILPKSC